MYISYTTTNNIELVDDLDQKLRYGLEVLLHLSRYQPDLGERMS